jgi:hypothetical protein
VELVYLTQDVEENDGPVPEFLQEDSDTRAAIKKWIAGTYVNPHQVQPISQTDWELHATGDTQAGTGASNEAGSGDSPKPGASGGTKPGANGGTSSGAHRDGEHTEHQPR